MNKKIDFEKNCEWWNNIQELPIDQAAMLWSENIPLPPWRHEFIDFDIDSDELPKSDFNNLNLFQQIRVDFPYCPDHSLLYMGDLTIGVSVIRCLSKWGEVSRVRM
ncbi:MAG: hypothetical protein ACI8PB_005081 [Desulforhopalus sp.]|jgi:hypothetical protein